MALTVNNVDVATVTVNGVALAGVFVNTISVWPDAVIITDANIIERKVELFSISTFVNDTVTEVVPGAFAYASNLQSVTLKACTSVGAGAFTNCTSLTTLRLDVCKSISNLAFENCTSLFSLYLLTSTVFTITTSSSVTPFKNTPLSSSTISPSGWGSIYVRSSLLSSFKTVAGWSSYSARFVGLTDAQIMTLLLYS